jgi:hypothetical protein
MVVVSMRRVPSRCTFRGPWDGPVPSRTSDDRMASFFASARFQRCSLLHPSPSSRSPESDSYLLLCFLTVSSILSAPFGLPNAQPDLRFPDENPFLDRRQEVQIDDDAKSEVGKLSSRVNL